MQVESASPYRPEPDRARTRLRLLAQGWPLVVALLAVLSVALLYLTAGSSSPTYLATGTYIVRSTGADDVTNIQATANLNGTVRIDTTFARIAESKLIGDRARESLGSVGSGSASRGAEVDAAVTLSANILSISARSVEPETAVALAAAVGTETIGYIEGFADLYDLTALDPPSDARRSSPPAVPPGPLLGAGLVGLGIGAATRPIVRGRLLARGAEDSSPLDTGLGNEQYTRLRLLEERSRTDSSGTPFHLLLVHPEVAPRAADIPPMAGVMASLLREEDHLGHLVHLQRGTLIVIAPGRTDAQVEDLAVEVRDAVIERLGRDYGPHVLASVHFCRYEAGGYHGDPEAIRMAEAL